MKHLFFPFLRKITILMVLSFLIVLNLTAQVPQVPLTIEDAVLTPSDLTGTYVIQTFEGICMSPFVGVWGDNAVIGFTGTNFAMDIVKASETTYYIQYGDKKINYSHEWDLKCDNTSADKIEWQINVISGDTVSLQRKGENKYIKYQITGDPSLTRFYSDAGDPTKLLMRKVTSKRPVNIPEASKYNWVANALNAQDLSGKYLIQNSTKDFMTTDAATDNDISIVASSDSAFALDLVKQVDGTYIISSGDLMANNLHSWLLRFDVFTTACNTWNINIIQGNQVTIQRARDGQFLKNQQNPDVSGIYKYYTNGGNDNDVNYYLQTVTGIVTDKIVLTNGINTAQALYDGTTDANYQPNARATFQEAINAAKSVKDNSYATQTQVDQALITLNAANNAFNASIATGIPSNLLSSVVISKNPVYDVLSLTNTSNVTKIAIYSTIGQEVYTQKVNGSELSISVNNWQSGLYLVKLTDISGQTKTLKIKIK